MKNNEKNTSKYKTVFQRLPTLVKTPIIIALLLTPIRFSLELAGLPDYAIFLIGLLWLTLVLSLFWGVKIYNEKHPYLLLLTCLIIFSPISRFPVSVIWWVDRRWNFGTHYGLYFDSFADAVLNQIVYGAVVQIIPGFLLGSITIAIMQNKNMKALKSKTISNE